MRRTVDFYSGVLGMPLTKTIALPDGGQHFFFDCGGGDSIAFFWFPDAPPRAPGIASPADRVDRGEWVTAHGSMNHVAINVPAGRIDDYVERLRAAGVDCTEVANHDDSEFGISGASYGMSLATGGEIEVGEAVGVIAAQSIGEPGTQLTMRTFHTGGVAGKDIAGGLPRVVELFEARSPKGKALLARTSGVIRMGESEGRDRVVTVISDDGEEDVYDKIPPEARLEVVDGQEIAAGEPIIEGPRDPKELLEIKGVRETQRYLVDEVQRVYRDQGVSIHDKHIELIVRQMTRRVLVNDAGDSDFLPGESIDNRLYAEANRQLVAEGKKPAEARPQLMGITKASLATDSWLSAASFQETTRVLTEAAIESRSDGLVGLKENIIIGKLIPAGTGLGTYSDFSIEAPDYTPMEFYSSGADEEDLADWLAGKSAFTDNAEVIDLAKAAGNGDFSAG